jgi:hypothetical protein
MNCSLSAELGLLELGLLELGLLELAVSSWASLR